jgi:lysophospholipase L1-like esterase
LEQCSRLGYKKSLLVSYICSNTFEPPNTVMVLLRYSLTLVCLYACSIGNLVLAQPGAATLTPKALAPEPRNDQAWWQERHAAKLAEKNAAIAEDRPINLVFVGDSITHSWENGGKTLWEERFAPRGALNIGFSGDRTEHVLWRLGEGDAGEVNNEIAGLAPKLFVIMIGTNNTGHRQDPADETAAGIVAIIDRLQELSPESRILLLGIFPRGATTDDPLRQINDAINERIEALGHREGVEFLNINDVFLDENGVLPKSVMPDLLHPQESGYGLWADAIEPHVARLMKE